jgi:hypothetical protein
MLRAEFAGGRIAYRISLYYQPLGRRNLCFCGGSSLRGDFSDISGEAARRRMWPAGRRLNGFSRRTPDKEVARPGKTFLKF